MKSRASSFNWISTKSRIFKWNRNTQVYQNKTLQNVSVDHNTIMMVNRCSLLWSSGKGKTLNSQLSSPQSMANLFLLHLYGHDRITTYLNIVYPCFKLSGLFINLSGKSGKLYRKRSPFSGSIFEFFSSASVNFCSNFTIAIFISIIANLSPKNDYNEWGHISIH